MEMVKQKAKPIDENESIMDGKDALFLQVRTKFSIVGEKTIGEIYDTFKDEDGFLYIMYTTELIYG